MPGSKRYHLFCKGQDEGFEQAKSTTAQEQNKNWIRHSDYIFAAASRARVLRSNLLAFDFVVDTEIKKQAHSRLAACVCSIEQRGPALTAAAAMRH